MRKLCFLLLLLLSCESVTRIPGYTETVIFDFTKYIEKEFYFFYNDYYGEYITVGKISIDYYPEHVDIGTGAVHVWEPTKIQPDTLIRIAYNEAIKLGANAICNFNTSPISKRTRYGEMNGINVAEIAIKID